MAAEDEMMDRLAIRAERMKVQAERAGRAQSEASARIDSIEHELEALKRDCAAAGLGPKPAAAPRR